MVASNVLLIGFCLCVLFCSTQIVGRSFADDYDDKYETGLRVPGIFLTELTATGVIGTKKGCKSCVSGQDRKIYSTTAAPLSSLDNNSCTVDDALLRDIFGDGDSTLSVLDASTSCTVDDDLLSEIFGDIR